MKNFEKEKSQFKWLEKKKVNFVRDVLKHLAQKRGDAAAMYWADANKNTTIISFETLIAEINRTASFFENLGLKQGDVVILVLGREQAWWNFVLAGMQLGIIISPGTTQLSTEDIAYRLEASSARAIVTTISLTDRVDQAAKKIAWTGIKIVSTPCNLDGWVNYDRTDHTVLPSTEYADTTINDHAFYFFTSGTTGAPKMTVHGHGYPFGHITTSKFWLDARENDVVWNISDVGWAKAAWTSLFAPWLGGAAIFAFHSPHFNPETILELLEEQPITTLCAPPTAYRMFVRMEHKEIKFKALRRCLSAGGPLNPEVIALWKQQTGFEICEGYGQTETVILCGTFAGVATRPGSMGVPAPGIDLRILDGNGNELPPNEEGELAIRVDRTKLNGLFLEYKDDPERTSSVFTDTGYYLTGDKAMKDMDNYIWFIGRKDDVILSAGYRIGPFEVESVLFEHPAVLESAVISSPDDIRGEIVKAFIVLQTGFEPSQELVEELQQYVKTHTASYKYPRKIEFVSSLPKTVSGKIKRSELKLKEWSNARKI